MVFIPVKSILCIIIALLHHAVPSLSICSLIIIAEDMSGFPQASAFPLGRTTLPSSQLILAPKCDRVCSSSLNPVPIGKV